MTGAPRHQPAAVRVRIHGHVQGVWFRGWTVNQARSLELDGWVRNRRDGTVEALFSGTEAAVMAMLERCRQGPPAAAVDRVETEPVDGTHEAARVTDFRQLPTV